MRTVSKPPRRAKKQPDPDHDAPKHLIIPEDSYALLINADNSMEIVTPHGDKLSDGHMLLLGIIDLLRTPEWAETLIDKTATRLKEIYDDK